MTTTSRTKPSVAFWATVVVAVVLAYPLSFGPVLWLCYRKVIPTQPVATLWKPVLWLERNRCTRPPFVWYCSVWARLALRDEKRIQ
jgi:hypothetical protein